MKIQSLSRLIKDLKNTLTKYKIQEKQALQELKKYLQHIIKYFEKNRFSLSYGITNHKKKSISFAKI